MEIGLSITKRYFGFIQNKFYFDVYTDLYRIFRQLTQLNRPSDKNSLESVITI